jgi:hypothetical protein
MNKQLHSKHVQKITKHTPTFSNTTLEPNTKTIQQTTHTQFSYIKTHKRTRITKYKLYIEQKTQPNHTISKHNLDCHQSSNQRIKKTVIPHQPKHSKGYPILIPERLTYIFNIVSEFPLSLPHDSCTNLPTNVLQDLFFRFHPTTKFENFLWFLFFDE